MSSLSVTQFNYEELDPATRHWMLEEFRREEDTNPYRSSRLSAEGLAAFPTAMEETIRSGNEQTLFEALREPRYWLKMESSKRGDRKVPVNAPESFSITEFNTWYVRGLARRLLEEGVEHCQVYRAAPAWEPRAECVQHDGQVYPVGIIYDGHRARYWPPPGNPSILSIPVGPNCHHTIRRHLEDTASPN